MTRFVSRQPGITSWHSFSAGAHYDPDNVAFGPVIGMDEHLVAPDSGFDWHGHRDVFIVSRVLAGTLRHEDSSGVIRVVRPGEFLVQSTGDGVRHTEMNALTTESLHFLQLTLLGSRGEPTVSQVSGPIDVAGTRMDIGRAVPVHLPTYVFVIDTGEDLRLTRPTPAASATGELLVVELSNAGSENRE